MPRFVRPAYIEGSNGDGTRFGTGPRSRDGWLAANVTVRTPAATISDSIHIDAGGRSGRVEILIPASFTVTTEILSSGATSLVIVQGGK